MGKVEAKQVSTEFVTTNNKDAVKLDEMGEPTDVTTLNTSTSKHGLCPKLSGIATEYLDGSGTFSTPAGGGGSSLDYSGDPADTLRGDGIWRPASFESLETLDFEDKFNNSSIHPTWTQTPNTGTLSEDATKLTSSHAGGETVIWWDPYYNIPSIGIDVEPQDFDMMVHVSNVEADNNSGLVVLHLDGDNTKFVRIYLGYVSSEYRVYTGNNNDSGSTVYATVGQDNCWLILVRRGASITIGYSLNNADNKPDVNDFTVLTTVDQADLFSLVKNKLKLGGSTWSDATAPGCDIYFKNFSIKYNTVSTRLRGYVGQGIDFHDALNNSDIHDRWTVDITDVTGDDPTITEDSSKLQIAYVGGQLVTWYNAENNDAPNVYMSIEPMDFVAKVHVSNIAASDANGGAIINYLDGDKTKYHRFEVRRQSGAYQVLSIYNDTGASTSALGQNSGWIAMVRRGYKIICLYSTNAVDNEPTLDQMTEHAVFDVQFGYVKNNIALVALTYGSNPAYDIHFKKFSLVYSNISLYQDASYLVEEHFETDGTETPDSEITFNLDKTPGGNGLASTQSGYHLFAYRNGNKLGYTDTLADRLHYKYNPAANTIGVWASGDVEEFEFEMIEMAQQATEIQQGSFQWKYLGEDTEIGTNALALYQFDHTVGQLNDRSGNGYTLTVGAGTLKKGMVGDLKGIMFEGTQHLVVNGTDENLRITGALTVEALLNLPEFTDSIFRYIVACEDNDELLTGNVLFSLANATSEGRKFTAFHEYGTGNNEIHHFDIEPMMEHLYYVALTRSSDGLTYKLYLNGVYIETQTASNAPAKDVASNTQKLRIGGGANVNNAAIVSVASVRISNSELTATQIANVYNQIKTTNIETPVALSLDQQGYTVEDTFSDSSIHSRWTVVTPGASTVTEGSDGIVLTPDGDNDPYFELTLPNEMAHRNWIAQVHCTFAFTSTPGDTGSGVMRIYGKGGGVEKYMNVSLVGGAGPAYNFGMQDSVGTVQTSCTSTMWMRLRRFGDEVRADYYSGAHTVDIDSDGYWIEYDSSKTWYVVPKSGTYDYPIVYETLQFKAAQWTSNPGVQVTFRKFKLRIF